MEALMTKLLRRCASRSIDLAEHVRERPLGSSPFPLLFRN
jgi:hypothetical protein